MKRFAIAYGIAAITMLPLDGAWIDLVAKDFYAARIGHLLAPSPSLAPALAFYLLYWLGIATLVVLPAVERGDRSARVLRDGALFGLVAYGTFDLTNQALLKDWPTSVTLADLAWGTFLTALASLASFAATKRFAR